MTRGPRQHVIPRTEVHELRAAEIGQVFRVSVALPRGYDPARSHPVLFALDADIGFGTAVEAQRMLSLDHAVPDLLIVGIGYPVQDLIETLALRTRDLTPSADAERLRELSTEFGSARARSLIGGAEAFRRFLEGEVVPWVEERYAGDPSDRAVAGHSLGGLFAAHCLVSDPGTFGRYLISSPSLGWDDEAIFAYEKMHAGGSRELRARVVLSIGGEESADARRAVRRFAAILRGRRYKGVELTMRTFAGQVHRSAPGAAIWSGLRDLYAPR